MEQQKSTVRQRSAQMDHVAENWPMIHALMGGTPAMRKAGQELLPKWPNEDKDSYNERLKCATLHPVFRRTVLVNAARPFAKPPTVEAQFDEEWLENVDLQGSSLALFSNSLLVDALAYGMAGCLAEYPRAANIRTKADEVKAGVRPYLVKYAPQSLLGWKVDDKFNLTQLRLLEHVEDDADEFQTAKVEQVRVLEPGRWRTYRYNKQAEDWVLFEEGTTTLDFIPFVFCYGLKIAFGHGHSPLLDLAFQNVEHYQSSSDQRTILHVARVPILVAKGFGDAQITIGGGHAVGTDNPDAKLEYVEHSGKAIDSGRQDLLDLEERMRATGAELISRKMTQTTATQIDAEGESAKSTLQQIVEAFEESLEEVLTYMGRWVGKDAEVEVEFFKAFDTAGVETESLAAAYANGVISQETYFEELQRRDILSLDRSWDDEQQRIQGQPKKPEEGKDGKPETAEE